MRVFKDFHFGRKRIPPGVSMKRTKRRASLCDPLVCSPPGSSVHGILQARALEWAAVPSSGDLPDSGIGPTSFTSPALAGWFFTTGAIWEIQKKDTKAKGYGQRIGAPEKSDRNIQGLTAQQRLHFTLRATRMAETGQT